MTKEEVMGLTNTPENVKELFKAALAKPDCPEIIESFKKQVTKGKYKRPLSDRQFEILQENAYEKEDS